MANLNRLGATTGGRSVGLQLRLDAAVHGAEQIRRSIHRFADGQDAVVLQDDGFVLAESFGETATFFVREHDAAEVVVDGVVFVESDPLLFGCWGLFERGEERGKAVLVCHFTSLTDTHPD